MGAMTSFTADCRWGGTKSREYFPTNQNSAHGIYVSYQVINDESHENPGTPGTKSKVFRNNLNMPCHPVCNWLYVESKKRDGEKISESHCHINSLAT